MTLITTPVESTQITCFEGPEKRLEVLFRCDKAADPATGLRSIPLEQVKQICSVAACAILSSKSNDFFDAYVLSESSLFIFPLKIIFKTCGTTTLLKALPFIFSEAEKLSLFPESVIYARKNYMFPDQQQFPHKTFAEEIKVLDAQFNGSGFVLGPVNGDHWHTYFGVAKDVNNNISKFVHPQTTKRFEVMMTGLNPKKTQIYYKAENVTASQVTTLSGIDKILPGLNIDEHLFDPCGYSMNGIRDNEFATIHITPEDHCSYASFETNANEDRLELLTAIIKLFEPKQAAVIVCCDTIEETREITYLSLDDYNYNMQCKVAMETNDGFIAFFNFLLNE